ncbi:MAG: PPC domain-containing DNA-binding protein [Burkholderiales bacterium]
MRLPPGADLKAALEALVQRRRWQACFVIAGIGSLRPARLRLAGQRTATVLKGPLEILTLMGTLGTDGAHLHIAVADARGKVTGGHLLAGALVHTTVEALLLPLPRHRFSREPDAATGYRELVIRLRRSRR